MQVKISNFRFATHFDNTTMNIKSDIKVPVTWNSPEGLTESKYSKASDIWSFGVIMWEIFTDGQIPYQSIVDIHEYLILNKERLVLPNSCPTKICDLIQNCWKEDPNQRYLYLFTKLKKSCRIHASDIVAFFQNYEK